MKNLITHLGAIVFGLLNLGCRDGKNELVEKPIGRIQVSVSVSISIKNELGTDLLDPNLPNSLKTFKVHYPASSVQEFQRRPLFEGGRAYVIEKYYGESAYHLGIILNIPSGESSSKTDWTITYLEFEDGNIDTIRAQYSEQPAWLVIDRATYNGVPVWDRFRDNGAWPTYEIIKR